MRVRFIAGIAVAVFFAGSARADTVVLRDGQRFEGAVEITDKEVRVELDIGSISFPKGEVASVESSASAVREFNERYWAVDLDDVPELQALADWATQNNLPSRAAALHARVVALDPENVRSRQALGHERKAGAWVDPVAEAEAARATAHRELAQQAQRENEAAARPLAPERTRVIVVPAPAPAPAPNVFANAGWGLWFPGLVYGAQVRQFQRANGLVPARGFRRPGAIARPRTGFRPRRSMNRGRTGGRRREQGGGRPVRARLGGRR